MKGLKLHPPLQNFFPNDEAVFPVYEKAVELNIPVVFHVGTTPFGSMCRLSQASPLLIDEVAVRFPQMRILLTHLGTLWHNEAFMVVEKNPNVFIDTAAYVSEIRAVLTPDMIVRIGADKIVFGTDYPMPYPGRPHRMKDFVDCIRDLGLSQDVLQGIFHDNFQRFLSGGGGEGGGMTLQEMLEKVRQLRPRTFPDSSERRR
jgi:predicted TIM-barrel fold metal-dependent hydrolase